MPKHKSNIIPFRRIAAIAACLVLVFSFATSANAFCFRDVWNAVVIWAQETFSFSMGVEVSEPNTEDTLQYSSLQEALEQYQIDTNLLPTSMPDGFSLEEIIIDYNPKQIQCVAIYLNQDRTIKVSIQSFLTDCPEQLEKSEDFYEIYSISNIDYYIFKNNSTTQVAWLSGNYECCISGDISIDEIKQMVNSIQKG